MNSKGNVAGRLRSPVSGRMYALSNGNVGATAKSVHSRHGQVIKFVDISLETMFRAVQLKSVLSTDYRYIGESKFLSAISKTFGGGKWKSPRIGGKKRRRGTEERKGSRNERIELRAYYILECKLTYLTLMRTKSGSLNVKKLIIRAPEAIRVSTDKTNMSK